MGGGWTACARVRVVRCVSGLCKAWRSRRAQTRPRPQSSCCPLPAQPALRDASASVCERTVQSGESTGGSADAGAQRAGAGGHRARRGTRERRVGSRCGRPCSSEATDWAALAPALWATPPRPARPWSSSWARPSSRQEPCAWAPSHTELLSRHCGVRAFALCAEGSNALGTGHSPQQNRLGCVYAFTRSERVAPLGAVRARRPAGRTVICTGTFSASPARLSLRGAPELSLMLTKLVNSQSGIARA